MTPTPRTLDAARVHEELMEWLIAMHARAPVDVIVVALTYEIARLIGEVLPPEVDTDDCLRDVIGVMRAQIAAHRSGRLHG